MNNVMVGGRDWVYYETIGGGQGGRPPRAAAFDGSDHGTARGPAPGQSGAGTGMTDVRSTGTVTTAPVPGQSGVHTGMTNTRNTPVEALERAYPLRVLRYSIRRGSGGRGLAPGGDGIVRDLQALEACTVSLVTERRQSTPWGLAGGEPGASGENWLLRGGDETRAQRLPARITVQLAAGDVIRILTPGGGGWGRPVT